MGRIGGGGGGGAGSSASGGAVPVVKQCKWSDMESTRSAGGESRSSTNGEAVGNSANGGAAWWSS
jgi:hypothetical protein